MSVSLLFYTIWAPSSEFVSSSIPSWQILTAHAQPFRGARDLAFCLKVPLDSLLVRASSEGSGETAQMRRLAWTLAARIGDKYQIRLTRSIYKLLNRESKMSGTVRRLTVCLRCFNLTECPEHAHFYTADFQLNYAKVWNNMYENEMASWMLIRWRTATIYSTHWEIWCCIAYNCLALTMAIQ